MKNLRDRKLVHVCKGVRRSARGQIQVLTPAFYPGLLKPCYHISGSGRDAAGIVLTDMSLMVCCPLLYPAEVLALDALGPNITAS